VREAVVTVLLLLGVAATWLGVAGASRLRGPLARLHAVTFINIVPGAAIAAAALVTEGVTAGVLKVFLVVLLSWAVGAALSHATGRALLRRHTQGEPP
jgi:multicomponent Na+:H+ antiporter subunit G